MTKYYLKLYHEALYDPKMQRLSDRLYRRCIECFLLAGDENKDGLLPPLGDIAWTFRADAEQLEAELTELMNVGILSKRDGCWYVTKFADRQETMDKAEYMRRKRDSARKQEHYDETYGSQLPYSYRPVTNSNTDIDIDIDIDIDKTRARVVTALCQVCANAGLTDRKTLELAGDLEEAGRDAAWVVGFGEWYEALDNGRPYLKHLQTFGGHYDRREVPHFAKATVTSAVDVEHLSGSF